MKLKPKLKTQKPKLCVSKTETETGTYFSTAMKPNQNWNLTSGF